MTEEKRKEDILKQYEDLPKGVVKYIDFLITKINKLVVENKRKQTRIDKMKNCWNCKYGFCGWSSESIIDGKRQCHAWNKEKEEYCDIGYQGKYQCWEMIKE